MTRNQGQGTRNQKPETRNKNTRIFKAVFLDRDGTIIEDVHYLRRVSDICWIPGAKAAIGLLKAAGYLVIVISNQSGIARGYFDESFLKKAESSIQEDLARTGLRIDAWYHCPHHPDATVGRYKKKCGCRKPAPGLIVEASKRFSIDLGQSFMIGDKLSDVEAGLRVGCTPILILTGKGRNEARKIKAECSNILVKTDILSAAKWIVEWEETNKVS